MRNELGIRGQGLGFRKSGSEDRRVGNTLRLLTGLLYLLLATCCLLLGCENQMIINILPKNGGPPYNSDIEMVQINGGSFQMGTAVGGNTDERPVRTVTLSAFKIGKYEITQGQWKAVMGIDDRINAVNSGTNYGRGDNYPMYYVSWYDVIVFCNKLSMAEGLTPVYTISGSTDPAAWGSVPTSSDSTWNAVTANWSANGYRLPTEAEWEYACRAGTTTSFNIPRSGGSDDLTDSHANIDSTVGATKPVGNYSGHHNNLGLHDMHGNVAEWCWDRYGTYPSSAENDPKGASSGATRVFRGGGWDNSATDTRSACRSEYSPQVVFNKLGFRLVRR